MFSRFPRARRALFALIYLLSCALAAPGSAADTAPKVVAVSISGNVHVPTDRIMAVVRTQVGSPFDPRVVQADIANIMALGYFNDQLPPLIKQRPGGVAVTYRVIENPVIKQIVFDGNAHVPADTLLALMDTSVGQVLNQNTFHQDVLKINSYYDKIGYGGQLPTHVKDLAVNAAAGSLTLTIQEALNVRRVIISPPPAGDPVLPPNVILAVLNLKPGVAYSEDLRDKDIDAIKKLYEKYDLQLGDFEGGIDPATINADKTTADVRYTISAARVGAIEITGNNYTKDEVIRRQLRLHPGMLVSQAGLKRDYDRLNNLGFFEKVELNPKPGPDPKKPARITLDWNVKEQRTGTASVGAGYSGGATGTGLTGNVSYSQNNINGTGNGATIQLSRGAYLTNVSLSANVPYLGNTERSQKYSFGGTLYTNSQTNFYPVYQAGNVSAAQLPVIAGPTSATTGTTPTTGVVSQSIPVQLVPNQNEVSGITADYAARSTGVSFQLGRRFTDYVTGSIGTNVSRVASVVNVPSGYSFLNNSGTVLNNPNIAASPFSTQVTGSEALGINAPSIANLTSTAGYNLRSVSLGLSADTEDNVFNPRRGIKSSITEELSGPWYLGSDFSYTKLTLDAAKFFPVSHGATFGIHGLYGTTTGAIPPNSLYTFSDQQLRGYSSVFYGTNVVLGQAEMRIPLMMDGNFGMAIFADDGGTQIRGAARTIGQYGQVLTDYAQYQFHLDGGIGLRFNVPQLGFRNIRLDFAHGSQGNHTSFGIGQSF